MDRAFYWVTLGAVVETEDRAVMAGDPVDPHALRIKVWANNPLDAITKVEEALASLIDSEVAGDTPRREPYSG